MSSTAGYEANSGGPMSDDQRDEFCKRLEKGTEEFFASRKASKYQEGWREDSWEREMASHPLFAQELPTNAAAGGNGGGDLPPLLEALRQIKYNEGENSPEELARSYKDDGNHLFKDKQFRAAVASYTEGIRQKTINAELNAQLHLNRAVAQFYLNNFGAALEDCIMALDFKPNYVKAMLRAAQCCWQLRKLDECSEFCRQVAKADLSQNAGGGGTTSPIVKEADELAQRVEKERKLQERNRRKSEKELRERHQKERELRLALRRAGVTLRSEAAGPNDDDDDDECDNKDMDDIVLPNLVPRFPALRDFPVTLESGADGSNEKTLLVWPVALVYPELKETDFVQRWSEDATFSTMLNAMYGQNPAERHVVGEEDRCIVYDPAKLQIWYRSSKNDRPVEVKSKSTLRQILAQKDFVIDDGVPSFWVTRKNSDFEKQFLNNQGI